MLYFRAMNKKINHICKQLLSIVSLDYSSSFEEPLEQDNPPEQYIKSLAIKIYKFLNKFSPSKNSKIF